MGPPPGVQAQVRKPSTDQPEEQGPLKLTTLAPQVSYSKPKDLISKPSLSHSSLVVALLSQVVAL